MGTLVGSIPQFQQQNIFHGPPLTLTSDEISLLLKLGIFDLFFDLIPGKARLIDEKQDYPPPTHEQKQDYDRKNEENSRSELVRALAVREYKKKQYSENPSKRRKGENEEIQDFEPTEEEIQKFLPEVDVEKVDPKLLVELKSNQTIPIEYLCQKRREGKNLSYSFSAFGKMYSSSQSTLECSQSWKYPSTNREQTRFEIFCDLWERGFYLTAGSKFGGDFLAYPGFDCQIRR